MDRSALSRTHQSSLELAIERGDWRAVGEAAAMMGDGEEGSQILHDSGGSLASSISESLGRQENLCITMNAFLINERAHERTLPH